MWRPTTHNLSSTWVILAAVVHFSVPGGRTEPPRGELMWVLLCLRLRIRENGDNPGPCYDAVLRSTLPTDPADMNLTI